MTLIADEVHRRDERPRRPDPVFIYPKIVCTKCGHQGATAKGLCLECTKGATAEKTDPDPNVRAGEWVRRSEAHNIEHHVFKVSGGVTIFTSCGQRMPVSTSVPGKSSAGSIYRCATCSNLAGDSDN